MIKTPPRLSPSELRAQRIRNAFLTIGAILLISLLLAVAWVGSAMRRRIPPSSLPMTAEFEGQLTFDPRALAALAVEELLPDEEPGKDETVRQLASQSIYDGFHPRAQVLFREREGRQEWVAYFPIRQPQRFFHQRLLGMLEGTPSLRPLSFANSDGQSGADSLGLYQAGRRGLVIQSSFDLQAPEPVEQPVGGAGLAVYTTQSDYVPEAWLRCLGPSERKAVEMAVVRRIEWRWDREGGAGEAVFECDDEEAIAVGWFHPLVPRGMTE